MVIVQDDLRIRYNTRGNNKMRGQVSYCGDREEHEGHWVGNCSGHLSMTVEVLEKIGVKTIIIPGPD